MLRNWTSSNKHKLEYQNFIPALNIWKEIIKQKLWMKEINVSKLFRINTT